MNLKSKTEKIKKYYIERVNKWRADCRSSMEDGILLDLEIETLLKYIKDGTRILDVGCANGYTDIEIAKQRKVDIVAIDYCAEMIAVAKDSAAQAKNLKGEVQFYEGNALILGHPRQPYDMVLTKRCLINIPSWQKQKEAIGEIRRVIKRGGIYLMSEATKQGVASVNALRKHMGLKDIPEPWYNTYLDEDKLLKAMRRDWELEKIDYFSSMYYLGSRVVQPLLVGPDATSYTSDINKVFARLPNLGNYGTQRIFIFRRKEN